MTDHLPVVADVRREVPSRGKEGKQETCCSRTDRCLARLSLGTAAPAVAGPQPPTNGGNGGGQSGQCTGPAGERPASCHSSK